jgi:hypothetical protein
MKISGIVQDFNNTPQNFEKLKFKKIESIK